MSGSRALLLFPLRPGACAARLESWRGFGIAPAIPALAAVAWFMGLDCRAADAFATGLAVLAGTAGLTAGATAGLVLARRLLQQPARPFAQLRVATVFAAWTPVVFAATLGAASLLGAGFAAALYAALLVVLWGVAAGMSVLGRAETGVDGGRLLVGSCCGLAGALAGLWLALAVIQARLVAVAPAPVAAVRFGKGDLLVVRAGSSGGPGAYLLLRAVDGPQALLGQRDAGGRVRPLGVETKNWREADWRPAGRVFFAFGQGGGHVVHPVPQVR